MDFENLKKWFSGKSLERLEKEAIPMLQASEEAGEWIPGASRKVRAILNKPTVAKKAIRADHFSFSDIRIPGDDGYRSLGYEIVRAMEYGHFESTPELLSKLVNNVSQLMATKALTIAMDFCASFVQVAELIARLDATRPKPVFTNIGVSPTISLTLKDMGLNLVEGSIRVCPIEYYRVQEEIDGKLVWVTYGRLLWPANTVFGASRHAHGNGHNDQCHACGHAIRNPYNWVPMLVDNAQGVPHALWVGRDCAQNLFGVKMKGDLNIAEIKKIS